MQGLDEAKPSRYAMHIDVSVAGSPVGCQLDEEVIMGYSLACGDVMPGCAATFSADTEDELLAQVGPHAAEAHGITEVTPEVLEAVKGAITKA
ncbi:MAG: hypothetical protein K0S92_1546 [Desertimonas sp.]|nr:hypothetical protein [Desertimonas sp.]